MSVQKGSTCEASRRHENINIYFVHLHWIRLDKDASCPVHSHELKCLQ